MNSMKLLTSMFILLEVATIAGAQGFSGTGGQNSFGGSGMGTGGTGFGGGMNSGFGMGMSSGMGGFGGGMNSGFGGMGGLGSSGFGGGGFGGGGFGTSSFGGSGFGQSSYGSNAQGGQAFVGRDSGDMAQVFNQLGRSSNQFFQQLNRTMGRGNRNRQTAQQENVTLPVRVQLNVAFTHPRPNPAMLATTVRGRLESLLTRRNIAAPEVEVVGDTVVLRGVAASDSQRLVIEKLVSLEPGVMTVENQMTVAEEPAESTESSPAPLLPPQSEN